MVLSLSSLSSTSVWLSSLSSLSLLCLFQLSSLSLSSLSSMSSLYSFSSLSLWPRGDEKDGAEEEGMGDRRDLADLKKKVRKLLLFFLAMFMQIAHI